MATTKDNSEDSALLDKKLNLIYVASNGRSGSTLLEMLIDTHPQCFSLGEFQMLPSELEQDNQPCGCGSKVSSCQFWSQIYSENKALLDGGIINKYRSGERNSGKAFRLDEVLNTVFDRPMKQHDSSTYGYDNFRVLASVYRKLSSEGVTHLVDASKDPYRLKWLALSGYFNISVLHIIKEPQAMVYSFSKGQDSYFQTMYFTLRMTLRWIVENYVIAKIIQKHVPKNKSLTIRYEELAENPDGVMNRVFRLVSLTASDLSLSKASHESHAISGNAMRFKSKEISVDRKWEKEMGALPKGLVLLLTAPFMFLYK